MAFRWRRARGCSAPGDQGLSVESAAGYRRGQVPGSGQGWCPQAMEAEGDRASPGRNDPRRAIYGRWRRVSSHSAFVERACPSKGPCPGPALSVQFQGAGRQSGLGGFARVRHSQDQEARGDAWGARGRGEGACPHRRREQEPLPLVKQSFERRSAAVWRGVRIRHPVGQLSRHRKDRARECRAVRYGQGRGGIAVPRRAHGEGQGEGRRGGAGGTKEGSAGPRGQVQEGQGGQPRD